MKLNTITRYVVALIDSLKQCRRNATRYMRAYRAEFVFQRPSRKWATRHFKGYLQAVKDTQLYVEMLTEHFTKAITHLTLKPRFRSLEVAA